VVEISYVVVCSECRLHWDRDWERAKCRTGDHEHRVFETHRHLDLVVLPDGTRITAASFDPVAPYARTRDPDYGLYLDARWQPPWDHGHVDWPDFGAPVSAEALAEALSTLLVRARSGHNIELGCIGGHGRTGTALACLAILSGYPAPGAVAWVRSNYCAKAVETAAQEAFVAALGNTTPA
jgi:hypothetical protein